MISVTLTLSFEYEKGGRKKWNNQTNQLIYEVLKSAYITFIHEMIKIFQDRQKCKMWVCAFFFALLSLFCVTHQRLYLIVDFVFDVDEWLNYYFYCCCQFTMCSQKNAAIVALILGAHLTQMSISKLNYLINDHTKANKHTCAQLVQKKWWAKLPIVYSILHRKFELKRKGNYYIDRRMTERLRERKNF